MKQRTRKIKKGRRGGSTRTTSSLKEDVAKLASLKRDLTQILNEMKSIDPYFKNDYSINSELWNKLNNTIDQINKIRNKRNFRVKDFYSKY